MAEEKLVIVKYPDPLLKRSAPPIDEIDDRVRERVRQMFDLMYSHKGVGLAAPQVGWSRRLFVMNPTGDRKDERVWVNPVIVAKSKETARSQEGCLSIPEVYAKIDRSVRIKIEGYDLEGNEVSLELADFPARICQHETDHLDGLLITDKMSLVDKASAEPFLRALRYDFEKGGARAPLM